MYGWKSLLVNSAFKNGVWDGPVIQAKLPKPLVTSDETTITLKIKLDT